jgi:hypothetical protein
MCMVPLRLAGMSSFCPQYVEAIVTSSSSSGGGGNNSSSYEIDCQAAVREVPVLWTAL